MCLFHRPGGRCLTAQTDALVEIQAQSHSRSTFERLVFMEKRRRWGETLNYQRRSLKLLSSHLPQHSQLLLSLLVYFCPWNCPSSDCPPLALVGLT